MTTTMAATKHQPTIEQIRDASARLRAMGINPLDRMGMADPGAADDGIYARERLDSEQMDRPHGTPREDVAPSTPEERIARIIAFADGLGRRAEINDMDRQGIRDAATWVHAYTGSFDFLNDLKAKGGVKSAGQAKGVVNCIRADLARGGDGQPAQEAPKPVEAPAAAPHPQVAYTGRRNRYDAPCAECGQPVPAEAGSLANEAGKWITRHIGPCPAPQVTQASTPAQTTPVANVPAGHYAIESSGDNDLAFYRVDRPEDGQFAGRVFVKMIVGGHPEQNVRAASVPGILARIEAAGIAESARLYGQQIGRCSRCNRSLTDETSRSLGIGPECRTKGM